MPIKKHSLPQLKIIVYLCNEDGYNDSENSTYKPVLI